MFYAILLLKTLPFLFQGVKVVKMKKRILRRTFYTFFSIILLYTLMIIITVTLFNFNYFSQQNDYKNQNFLNSFSHTIDAKISNAFHYVSTISKQASIREYISNSNSSLLYFPTIYDDLVNSLYSTDNVDVNVGITKVSDKYVVSQDGYFTLTDYFNHLGISEDLMTSPQFIEQDKNNNFYVIDDKYQQNVKNTTFISKNYNHQFDEYLYIFISIPNEKLFPQELENMEGSFYLDKHVAGPTEGSPTIAGAKESENFEDLTIYHTKDNKILYSIPSSVLKSMQYSYSVEETKFLQFEPDFVSVLMLFGLCLFLLGGIILYFATIKSYNPIQDILNTLNEYFPISFKDNKGNKFSELDYIIGNIDNIQHKNKELEERINDSLSVLQAEFFSSVLFGTINKEEISHKLMELNMEKFNGGGIIAIVSIESPDSEREDIPNTNLLVLRNKVITLINDVNNELPSIQIAIDYKNICIIFPYKEADRVNDQLTEVTSYVDKKLSIKLTFSVSEPVESIYNFNMAFIEAMELTLKKYMYAANPLNLFSSREPLINDDSYSYSLDDERFLMNAIIDNDLELARKLVQDILDENLQCLYLSTINTIKFKYVLLNTVKRLLNYYDRSINEFSLQNKGLFDLLNSNDKDDIHFSFKEIFEVLFHNFIISFKEISDPTTLRILDFITDNFQQDLSLTDISIKFGLTEGYISRLLKKNANINFKKYLNNLKINEAKELLKNGNHKVNEVSTLVGYKNVNTFIRIFKQQEGIPPGEFSKLR